MTLPAGQRLGPYEILEPLGAGGMGEVYRARDSRLDRVVAIKILPSHLSSNEEIRQRFEREARAISALSHPHICALHDIGRDGDTEYLVMEYLDGESLARRLARGPLPIEQMLRYGVEIADALDRAHRQGIVHRDLKPGNVMVTRSGIKLVDFGLAKLVAPAGPVSGISILETQPKANLTQEGVILGTFQYMAPEQLEGREADARSDIFAFGALLYEMTTGRKAFEGTSQASLIAAILGSQPPSMTSLSPLTPPALDRVVRTCLAKDPDDRWQSAHDVSSELKWIAEAGSQAGVPAPVLARRRSRERLAWTLAAIFAVLAVAAGVGYLRRAPRRAPVRVTSLVTPEKRFVTFLAISPDASRIAFTALRPGQKNQLWIRDLGASEPRPLAGTDGADHPFWSPDGRSVGFFADAKLKRIDAGGGPAVVLCEVAPNGLGGTWNRDGTILFARPGSPIQRIPEGGGAPEPVTRLDASRNETTHRYPWFLPDGRRFLYLAANLAGAPDDPANRIRMASIDGKEDRVVLAATSNPVYANGYLFFVRGRDLLAQRLDERAGVVSGAPLPVSENVSQSTLYWNFGIFSAAADGTIAHGGSIMAASRLLWFDRAGREAGAAADPTTFKPEPPRISPDGRRLAFAVRDASTRKVDIWIRDVERNAQTRLTTGSGNNSSPVWSPDGRKLIFQSDRKHQGDLYSKSTAGGVEETLLEAEGQRIPDDWSRDGKFLAFELRHAKGDRRVALAILELATGKVTTFHQRAVDNGEARFSPDGRWLAYSADESGQFEIYVAAFPGPGERLQVSSGGGIGPVWRRDGRELYYLAPDGRLMAVEIRVTGASVEAGSPRVLFEPHPRAIAFDAAPDGERFLVIVTAVEQSPPITLVQNWAPREGR